MKINLNLATPWEECHWRRSTSHQATVSPAGPAQTLLSHTLQLTFLPSHSPTHTHICVQVSTTGRVLPQTACVLHASWCNQSRLQTTGSRAGCLNIYAWLLPRSETLGTPHAGISAKWHAGSAHLERLLGNSGRFCIHCDEISILWKPALKVSH